MSDVHEHLEHAEHVEHAAHSNKKIALVIAVLALFLAFSETLGKGAQTAALSENIQASDLWNFFQAKTIRQTVLRTAGETNAIELAAITDAGRQGRHGEADRYLEEDHRSLRVRSPRPTKAARSSPSAPRSSSTCAIPISQSTRTTSWPPPPFRSASCWRRRRSSPACWRWSTAPPVSAPSGSCSRASDCLLRRRWSTCNTGSSMPARSRGIRLRAFCIVAFSDGKPASTPAEYIGRPLAGPVGGGGIFLKML